MKPMNSGEIRSLTIKKSIYTLYTESKCVHIHDDIKSGM